MEGGSPMCRCMLIGLFDLVKKKYLYDVFYLFTENIAQVI